MAVDLQSNGEKDLQEIFDLYDVVTGKIEDEEINLVGKLTKLTDKQEAGQKLTSKEEKRLKGWIDGGGTIGRTTTTLYPPGYDTCVNVVCNSPDDPKGRDISKFGLSSCSNIPSCVEKKNTECTSGRCGGG